MILSGLGSLRSAQRNFGDYAEAMKTSEESLELARAIGEFGQEALALFHPHSPVHHWVRKGGSCLLLHDLTGSGH